MSLNCTVQLLLAELTEVTEGCFSQHFFCAFPTAPSTVSPLVRLPIFTPSSWLILGNLCDHSPHTTGTCFLIVWPHFCFSYYTLSPILLLLPLFLSLSIPSCLPTVHPYQSCAYPTQLLCFSWQKGKMLLRCWPRW